MSDSPFETGGSDPVKVTLKAGSGYDAPWITISGKTVNDVHYLMEKEDGADLMQLMAVVSGAGKAFNQLWSGKGAPEPRTQGKPQGANAPSPEKDQDPFNPKPVEDDAPPFGGAPSEPTCKHGLMKKTLHKGVTGYICQGKDDEGNPLDRQDPRRCASVML